MRGGDYETWDECRNAALEAARNSAVILPYGLAEGVGFLLGFLGEYVLRTLSDQRSRLAYLEERVRKLERSKT